MPRTANLKLPVLLLILALSNLANQSDLAELLFGYWITQEAECTCGEEEDAEERVVLSPGKLTLAARQPAAQVTARYIAGGDESPADKWSVAKGYCRQVVKSLTGPTPPSGSHTSLTVVASDEIIPESTFFKGKATLQTSVKVTAEKADGTGAAATLTIVGIGTRIKRVKSDGSARHWFWEKLDVAGQILMGDYPDEVYLREGGGVRRLYFKLLESPNQMASGTWEYNVRYYRNNFTSYIRSESVKELPDGVVELEFQSVEDYPEKFYQIAPYIPYSFTATRKEDGVVLTYVGSLDLQQEFWSGK
jgi:hypothetical protein